MASYKSFFHVLRMDDSKFDVEGFLKGIIYAFPKLDGTNSCIWADNYGKIHAGGRKREISLEQDNQDFMLFVKTDKSVDKLKEFCVENPNFIVYGEWLNGWNGRKQIGSIKQYVEGGFWIFAVFDIYQDKYLHYDVYAELLNGVYDKILEPIKVLGYPKKEDCEKLVGENHFDLPEGVLGEGIVFYNYGYRDRLGKPVIAKIIAQEYRERKGRVRAKAKRDGIEQDIVDAFVGIADFEKCKQKVEGKFGIEWDLNDRRMISAFLSMLFNDLVEEEMWSIVKSFREPVIDFRVLKNCVFQAGRKYLGFC